MGMSEADALRRENMCLREVNASLSEEVKLARESQAMCFEQLRALLAITEKYALLLRNQTDADQQELSAALHSASNTVQGRAPPLAQLSQPPHQTPPVSFTSNVNIVTTTPVTPAKQDTSFASLGGATPVVTQQLVHDSPPFGTRLPFAAGAAAASPVQPAAAEHARLACPTKKQRKALLAGDTWAPKGSEFDSDLVVGVPIPALPTRARIEPMLQGGRIYKIQTDLGADNVDISFFNGTRDMQFTLDYTFLEGSLLYPGSDDVAIGGNQLAFSLTVFPGQTKTLVTGRVNGYSMNLRYGYASSACIDHFKPALDAKLSAASAQVRSLCQSSNPPPVGSASVADLCALGGVAFVDPEFPPAQTSLCRIHEGSATLRPWVKLEEALVNRSEWAVGLEVAGGIEPHDIEPGLLGDAWLLSAMAAVAEHPAWIRCLFEAAYSTASRTTPLQDHRSGIYRTRLCASGWWTTVVIDDWLPASPLGPAFARSLESPGSLWAALVEKSFAKVYGSYQALKGIGEPLHALTDMTGCGCDFFNWRQPAEAVGQLKAAVAAGYLVILTTPGLDAVGAAEAGESEEALCTTYQNVGLATGFSYAVLAAEETHCVVRNAWGDASLWKGDSDAAQGSIDVHYDDLCTLFDSGGVCYAKNGQMGFRVQVSFSPREGPDVMVAVEAPRECSIVVTIHQPDQRGCDSDAEEVSAYCTSVVAERNGEWDHIASSHNGTFWKGREAVLRMDLSPSMRPYYFVPRAYREDVRSTVTLSFVLEGTCEGTVARFLRPTPAVMEALCFNPIYNFDPAPCQPVRPQVQTGRSEPVPSQSVTINAASLLHR